MLRFNKVISVNKTYQGSLLVILPRSLKFLEGNFWLENALQKYFKVSLIIYSGSSSLSNAWALFDSPGIRSLTPLKCHGYLKSFFCFVALTDLNLRSNKLQSLPKGKANLIKNELCH